MTSRDYEIELRLQKLRETRRRKRFLTGILVWCAAVWMLVYLLFGVCVVEGNSMRPSFLPGDIVIYRRGVPKNPEYKDVVILDTGLDERIIKRIEGKPGDIIEIDEKGHLTRNGESVREPEILFGYQEADSNVTYPYTVEEEHFFYMGDNRPVSLDSRILGAAKAEDIRGKVIGVIRFGSWNQKSR